MANHSAPSWSKREREILDLIAAGRTNGEIAEALGISFATAKWHVSELISKLGVESREDVAVYWQAERSPLRRIARALSLGALPIAAKVGVAAMGAAAASVAVFAGISLASGTDTGGVPEPRGWTLAATEGLPGATATATPTATAAFERPAGCPQPPWSGQREGLCRYDHFPELAALDKGGCDFSGERIPNLFLSLVDMSGCNLEGANLGGVAANDWSFAGANLRGASLDGGTFGRASFAGADLANASLVAVFAEADFTDANLEGAFAVMTQGATANWTGATCPNGIPAAANGGSCVGAGVLLFDPSSFEQGDACPTVTTPVRYGTRCDRSEYPVLASLPGVATCDLAGADLSGAFLGGADLIGCDLAGADLSGAILIGANLWRARLDGANLAGAILVYTMLEEANATSADFSGARVVWVSAGTLNAAGATCPGGAQASLATCLEFRPANLP